MSNNKHHASISKTDQLFYCQYWASPAVTFPPKISDVIDDIPRFGLAFHKCGEIHLNRQEVNVKEIATSFDVDEKRLRDYYRRWSEAIEKLLKKRGWEDRFRIVEQKIAINPFQDTVRFLTSEKERDYSEAKRLEIPGTGDLILAPAYNQPFVTIDWKTGQSSYDAKKNGQLKTLSYGFSRHFKSYEAINIIFRIDDEFMEISEAPIYAKGLNAHRDRLRKNLALALSNSPPMRIGQYCGYCEALEVCPAHQQPFAIGDVEIDSSESAALLYERILPAEKLLKKKRDRIRNFVEANGPVGLDNGKFLQLKEYSEENLSKASIKRVMGEIEGEEFIQKLRGMGVIESKKEIRLMPLADPSSKK